MSALTRSCRDCTFHVSPAELGDRFHLCTLPPDCAPPAIRDMDGDGDHGDGEGRIYLGTSCHVMRRRGAACGPHAALWCCVQTPTCSASSAAEGADA